MSLPLPRGVPKVTSDYAAKRRNWIGRYLDVERDMDIQVYNALKDALVAVDDSLTKLVGKETKSAATRRLQLALTSKEIRSVMTDLYGNVGSTIKEFHGKAAGAAADAAIADQKRLIAKLFGKDQVAGYAASLHQTAVRNIESVMTRVLETQQPLSKRVYKTKALSQGLVDRAINNGIARGDSFTNIANSVKHLIDPDVPGGVSYAAKRLARTETNNAFHAQSIHDAQDQPWNQAMRWNLSKVHQEDPNDPCEDYARQATFDVNHVPNKPHPHCRCFVTPEPVSDETFDHAVIGGQYDNYLDNWLNQSTPAPETPTAIKASALKKAPSMKPAPKENATTKAFQPDGWTGPPVAKAAANKEVRQATDDIWNANSDDVDFLQAAREGSRNVQTKGYKGGLSSPDKNAILAFNIFDTVPDKLGYSVGREMTARLAHAARSTESVYKSMDLTATEVKALYDKPGLSIPLSQFETGVTKAVDANKGRAIGATGEEVVFEVVRGARTAVVGDSRITMGHFQVIDIQKRTHPTGGSYLHAKIRQGDPREFEADTPRGKFIPDIEFVNEAPDPVNVPTGNAPAKKVAKNTKTEPLRPKVQKATTIKEVADLFMAKWPRITLKGWDSSKTSLESVKSVASKLDEVMTKYPVTSLRNVEFGDEVGTAYAHVSPKYNRSGDPYYQEYLDDIQAGLHPSPLTTTMRISPQFATDPQKARASLNHSETLGWLTAKSYSYENIWDSTVAHEYAHVMDFDTNSEAKPRVWTALVKHYEDITGKVYTQKGFTRWIQGDNKGDRVYLGGLGYDKWTGPAPSKYSVSDPDSKKGYNEWEMIAESFADVNGNGDNAKEVSKIVVRAVEIVREGLNR